MFGWKKIFRARPSAGVCVAAASLAQPLIAQPLAGQDDGEAFIDALYGERIDAVQSTRTDEDDLALMAEMLDIAPTLPDAPDAKSAVFVRLIEMSAHARAGYALALQAIDRLAEHHPDHPSANAQARLDVYEAWYRSADRDQRGAVAERYFNELVAAAKVALDQGDHASAKRWYSEAGSVQRVARLETDLDLREKLAEVRQAEAIGREIEHLRGVAGRAAITPAQARRLVVLLVTEADAVGEAAGFAGFLDDPAFAEGLDAANELGPMTDPDNDRPPPRWRLAGHWYAALADESGLSERAELRMVARARAALGGYIERSAQDDVEKARAAILLRQLDDRHAELVQPPQQAGRDLMRLLDPQRHMIYGEPFTVEDGKLALAEKAILHLPVEGGDHYALEVELELGAARKNGMHIWLPVAGRTARLLVDITEQRGTKIDGLNYIEDPEGLVRLEQGVPAVVRIEVRSLPEGDAAFRLSFNGRAVWQWRGSATKLTDPNYGKPPDVRHLSVKVDTDALFHRIEMQPLDEAEEE